MGWLDGDLLKHRQPIFRALGRSLLLHALAGVAIWFWLRHGDSQVASVPASRLAGPLNVTLSPGGAGSWSEPAGPSPNKPPHSRTKPTLRLGPSFRLGGAHDTSGAADAAGASVKAGGGGQGGPADGYETANAMGIEEESRLYPFFSALWNRIDRATGYPDDFVRERVAGFVTAQLVVDPRGVFTGKLVRVDSDQPLLEAYVLALLFHALTEPLPRELWSGREPVILVARFDFRTFTFGQVPPARERRELKNVLEFGRYGYTDPKVKQVIEKWMTHYLPPIIPVPGGFYIDFIRAYQLVQNLRNRGKSDEDDLRAERIQLMREQWQGLVRPVPGSP